MTGLEMTGLKMTGLEMTGLKMTGLKMTGLKMTGFGQVPRRTAVLAEARRLTVYIRREAALGCTAALA